MRALTEPPEDPPLSPGSSPFRVKGTAYAGHMAWVAQHFPGGRHAFLAELSEPMREFFDRNFLVMGLFDVFPLVCAGATCGRVLGMPFRKFVAMRARHQATEDLNGLYRALLRLSSPQMVNKRLPTLMAQYLDYVKVSTREIDRHSVAFTLSDVPTLTVDWMWGVYQGYGEVVLSTAGASESRVEMRSKDAGELSGVRVSRIEGVLRWSRAAAVVP